MDRGVEVGKVVGDALYVGGRGRRDGQVVISCSSRFRGGGGGGQSARPSISLDNLTFYKYLPKTVILKTNKQQQPSLSFLLHL